MQPNKKFTRNSKIRNTPDEWSYTVKSTTHRCITGEPDPAAHAAHRRAELSKQSQLKRGYKGHELFINRRVSVLNSGTKSAASLTEQLRKEKKFIVEFFLS